MEPLIYRRLVLYEYLLTNYAALQEVPMPTKPLYTSIFVACTCLKMLSRNGATVINHDKADIFNQLLTYEQAHYRVSRARERNLLLKALKSGFAARAHAS